MYYRSSQLQLKLKGNRGLPVGSGAQGQCSIPVTGTLVGSPVSEARGNSRGVGQSTGVFGTTICTTSAPSAPQLTLETQCGSQGRTHTDNFRCPLRSFQPPFRPDKGMGEIAGSRILI